MAEQFSEENIRNKIAKKPRKSVTKFAGDVFDGAVNGLARDHAAFKKAQGYDEYAEQMYKDNPNLTVGNGFGAAMTHSAINQGLITAAKGEILRQMPQLSLLAPIAAYYGMTNPKLAAALAYAPTVANVAADMGLDYLREKYNTLNSGAKEYNPSFADNFDNLAPNVVAGLFDAADVKHDVGQYRQMKTVADVVGNYNTDDNANNDNSWSTGVRNALSNTFDNYRKAQEAARWSDYYYNDPTDIY